jgi:hypothetical protein
MPDDVVEHYKLRELATPDGAIYCEIRKGMYGLPQAGIIAQQLLEERLAKHGYRQSARTPDPGTVETRHSPYFFQPRRGRFWRQICRQRACTTLVRDNTKIL